MTLYAFTDKKVLTIREQLQEDLVKDIACQIVVENFADLIK
jgi:hypothetical protein